jgi:hypothetical protein
VREEEGNKREGENCWKSGGEECAFIPDEGRAVRAVTGPLDRRA